MLWVAASRRAQRGSADDGEGAESADLMSVHAIEVECLRYSKRTLIEHHLHLRRLEQLRWDCWRSGGRLLAYEQFEDARYCHIPL